MATYFNDGSSEIEAPDGGIHTLYLMNPNYATPFSDETLHHHHHHHHRHLLGMPLSADAAGSNNSDYDPAAISATRPPPHQIPTAARVPYGLWALMAGDSSGAAFSADVAAASQFAFRRPPVPASTGPPQQGLSLSLSSRQTVYPPAGNSQSSSSSSGVILGSKYLNAVREVLDEVINVGKETMKATSFSGEKHRKKMNSESSQRNGGSKQPAQLATAQRQELQIKKAKLVSMLDEVHIHIHVYIYMYVRPHARIP